MRRNQPALSGDILLETALVSEYHLSGRAAHQLARKIGTKVGRVRLVAREKLIEYLSVNAGCDAEEKGKDHGS